MRSNADREINDINRNIQAAQMRINEIYAAIGRTYRAETENPQGAYIQMFADLKATEEQIEQMYQFDLVEFNSRRRFSEHTQQFSENAFEESDDDKSPLLEKYLAQLSTSLDFSFAGDRYGWVEEIEKPELIKGIKALSKEDIELITLYVFDDLTQNEIGVRFGISQKAVSKRIEQIRKHLNKFS